MTPPPSISGTVSRDGKPLGGAYVRLYGPSGEFVAEEYTKDDGAFAFHVVPGTWKLEARASGAQTATQPVEVTDATAPINLELQSA
jgi:hypothetical protein